jgi:hypothetical protein
MERIKSVRGWTPQILKTENKSASLVRLVDQEIMARAREMCSLIFCGGLEITKELVDSLPPDVQIGLVVQWLALTHEEEEEPR